MQRTFVTKLTRVHDTDGWPMGYFTMPRRRKVGRSIVEFVSAENVPEVIEPTAWFEMEWVSAKPRGFYGAIRRGEPPG